MANIPTRNDNMLNKGDKITIRSSKWLIEKGLRCLFNKKGIVTKILTVDGKLVGAFVDVKVQKKIKNYYVPSDSIEGIESISRMRTLSLLKDTVL